MQQDTETISSADANTLGEIEIEYAYDEELTVPQFAGVSKVLIGTLGDDIIVSSVWRNSGKTSGNVVFDRQNTAAICEAIEQLVSAETRSEEPILVTNGKDSVTVSFTSSWPHNTTAPLERIQVINRRNYLLDGLESHIVEIIPTAIASKKVCGQTAPSSGSVARSASSEKPRNNLLRL